MVKSDLCWMKDAEKDGCDFDNGAYFIVKGAEKTFIAQEQICMRRLWVTCNPYWKVSYRGPYRKKWALVKLVENPKAESIRGGESVLRVYSLFVEVPLWILFFALGVSSDKEILDLIECDTSDGRVRNILMASIHDADEECEGFRSRDQALSYLDECMKKCPYPPKESVQE